MGNGTYGNHGRTRMDTWLSKEAAARATGRQYSPVGVENLAALGRIRKNRLETARLMSARRACSIRLTISKRSKRGKPRLPDPSETPVPERTPTRRDSVPSGDLIGAIPRGNRARGPVAGSPNRTVRRDGYCAGRPSRYLRRKGKRRQRARIDAMMASIDRFIELLATRQNEQAAETGGECSRAITCEQAGFPPPQPESFLG